MEKYAKMYAVIATCILGATLVIGDVTSDTFDETTKCMPPLQAIEVMLTCYKTITGSVFDPSTTKESDLTIEVRRKVLFCVAEKFQIVTSDGKTFNLDKAIAGISFYEADEAIKTALIAGIKDCGTKSADGQAFIVCFHDAFLKECK